jgi:hypothetical protein
MKNFNFTKQLVAAALVATVGFFGCQKNEMDEVSASMSASTELDAIAGSCYDTYLGENLTGAYKVKGDDQTPIAIANLEVGNNDDNFLVQVTLVEANGIGITGVEFKIGGVNYGASYDVEDLRTQALFEIPRNTLGVQGDGSVTVTDVIITAKLNIEKSSDAKTNRLGPFNYEYRACATLVCAHERDYWKNADNAWSNFSKVNLGYNEAFLRANLNSSANRNSVKLLQSLTVASLNIANVAEGANGVAALKDAIDEAKAALKDINVEDGQDMSGKIKPGLIGRLHQIPSCE